MHSPEGYSRVSAKRRAGGDHPADYRIQTRAYLRHTIYIDDFEGAALLDAGVRALLPAHFTPSCPSPRGTFEILRATGGKGLGMFARRDIPAGGLILVERPVVVSPSVIRLHEPLSEVYSSLFNRLSPSTYRELMNLANGAPPKECSTVEGIMRTNALGIELEVPDIPNPEHPVHHALFLNTSRCNHRLVLSNDRGLWIVADSLLLPSCGPNARWEWDLATFSLYLEALRPIRVGEEITIPYMDIDCSRQNRRDYLRSAYGFDCRCEYCVLPTRDAIARSDYARLKLREFWDLTPSFEQWCLDASMGNEALLNAHKHALQLIDQEGLQILDYAGHVDAIAMCYGALGDVDKFRRWVGMVRDLRLDGQPEKGIVFAKWLSNPVTFPAWGWRKSGKTA